MFKKLNRLKLTKLDEYLFINGTIIQNGEDKFVQAISCSADDMHLIQLVRLFQVRPYRLLLFQSDLFAIHLLQASQESRIAHHSFRSFP